MSGKKNELHGGKPGYQHVEEHAQHHDQGRDLPQLLQRNCRDGFVVRHDAVYVESSLEHFAEHAQGLYNQRGAALEDEEAEYSLYRALDHIA